ncbi:hypothetical protein [Algoriphagus antarcticus]|uniref:hypothetical protein n=1 Tax=Algoriphagus antarcticus TaxID=238540 RepID=UPI001120466C|nr:hypothetical protein [Algoriphagus antarcticus]
MADQTQLVSRIPFDTAEECQKINAFALDKNEENYYNLKRIGKVKIDPNPTGSGRQDLGRAVGNFLCVCKLPDG